MAQVLQARCPVSADTRDAAQPSQGTDTIPPTLGKYFLQSVGLAAATPGCGAAGDVSTVLIGAAAAGASFGCPPSLSISLARNLLGGRLQAGKRRDRLAVDRDRASAASVFQTPSTSYQRAVP